MAVGDCLNCGHASMHHPNGECYLCDCENWEMEE